MSRFVDLDQVEFLKVDGNKEFNHGVDCCINRLLKAEPIKAIPLDKVKQAREEIDRLTQRDEGTVETYEVLEILDKLIESEE
jgi:hypothetical protein